MLQCWHRYGHILNLFLIGFGALKAVAVAAACDGVTLKVSHMPAG